MFVSRQTVTTAYHTVTKETSSKAILEAALYYCSENYMKVSCWLDSLFPKYVRPLSKISLVTSVVFDIYHSKAQAYDGIFRLNIQTLLYDICRH